MYCTKIALLILLSLAGYGPLSIVQKALTISGRVIAVSDGDTIEIMYNGGRLKVRLAHIDCPEIRGGQPYGRAAKKFTSDICFGQQVRVENEGKYDRYHRIIGVVINAAGENVNKALVKSGLAWHFKKYSADQSYASLEEEARNKRVGIWQDKNPTAPWDWRDIKRQQVFTLKM